MFQKKGISALRLARLNMGATQQAVSNATGVPRNSLAMIEGRKLVAAPKHREGLSSFFGRSEDCFFDAETGLAR